MNYFQNLIDILRGKKQLQFCPSPKVMSSSFPEIYNKKGEPLEAVYLQDTYLHPYAWQGDYLFFDRYNYGLKTHLYTHQQMLKTIGKPTKKYGALIEAESIVPDDYKIFDKHKHLSAEFDKIFTHSSKLLDSLPNAVFFPAGNAWVENNDTEVYNKKTKLVSMICSKKVITDFHKLRVQIARKLKQENLCDLFGNLDGGPRFEKKEDTLLDYRFQVVVENDVLDFYFTEKILDCFLSFTIPVYIGALKIGQFFNLDGIIQIDPKDYDRVDEIVKQLTPEYYIEHLDAVKDNYNRAMKLNDFNAFLYREMKD